MAFKTKYPLLGWFEYFALHHMIQYINIWMQHVRQWWWLWAIYWALWRKFWLHQWFVTNTRSYGASWYSSNLWKIVSSCPEPMSPSSKKKKRKASPKLKMLGPLCNQTVSLKTHSKTLYCSTLKLKYSPSILKHNKG